MSNNWFALTTDGANTWGPLEGDNVLPTAGVLRFVGQAPTVYGTEGSIDGSGVLGDFVEADLVLFFDVIGQVTTDLTLRWQVQLEVAPSTGTLRLVGQAPTVTPTTITYVSPTVGTVRLVGQTPTVTPTGNRTVAPTVGTIRFVGNIPSLDPKVITPVMGTVRFSGQVPGVDIGHKVATPTPGTIRFKGWGAVTTDLTVTYQVLDTSVTSDVEFFWQRAGSVESDLTVTWQVHRAGDVIRLRPQQKSITAESVERVVELRESRKTITLRAA